MKNEEKILKNQEFRNAYSSLTHAKAYKQEKAITLIALIVTIVLNACAWSL